MDCEALAAGFPRRSRIARLDRDYEENCGRLDRTLYAIMTYKMPGAFQWWEPCRYDETEETTGWQDGPPMPDYADLRAVPAWAALTLLTISNPNVVIQERLNDMLQANSLVDRNISKDALTDDSRYLDELVEEEGVDATARRGA